LELTIDALLSDGRWVGNLGYLLLIASMAMRDIFWLRLLAIFSGLAGATYDFVWLHDPIGTFWELCFTLVNVIQWTWLLYERRHKVLSPEEAKLKSEVFPMLSVADFRRLIANAETMTFLRGDILLRQGDEVHAVFLILTGEADIVLDGEGVTQCVAGDFIGEIGFFNAAPASATVTAAGTMKCLVFEVAMIRRLMERSSELERGISVAMNSNVATKLIRRNETGATV
jgi:hypothetical protein